MITPEEKKEFLHGACVEFACVLHDRYGYTVEHLRHPDGTLCHAYCIAHGKELRYFIDIRGITDNWNDFVSQYYQELRNAYDSVNVLPSDYQYLNKYQTDDPHSVFRNDPGLYQKAEGIILRNEGRYIFNSALYK